MTLSQTLGLVFRTRDYVLLIFGFFVCGFHYHTHANLHRRSGFDVSVGAWELVSFGLFNNVSSMSCGALGARWPKQYKLSVVYIARSITITFYIALPMSEMSMLIFAVTMGLLWLSSVPQTSGLVAVMFATCFMGTLLGIVFFSHQNGSFLAARPA